MGTRRRDAEDVSNLNHRSYIQSQRVNTMQMQFQHVASSTQRNKNTVVLTLYGRMTNGKSIAAHIPNLVHYGYFQCDHWESYRQNVIQYINAWFCYETSKKYGIGDPDPHSEHYIAPEKREEFFKNKGKKAKYTFSIASGFNIRDVREGAERQFIRFETLSPRVYKAICHVLTSSREAKRIITSFCAEYDFEIELPDAFPPFRLYETHIAPEVQYMVDHQLTSCGWMCAVGSRGEKETTCDIDFMVHNIFQIEGPQDLAPIRVLSYDTLYTYYSERN